MSFGKTIFSDPIADPTIKTAGESKRLAFSKAGIVMVQEAVGTQQMDALGRFGWEMVGTVGLVRAATEGALTACADAALYRAKAGGRNRVERV